MNEVFEFIGDQIGIISAIVLVLALIIQEIISNQKGSKYEVSPEEAAVMMFKGAKIIDIRDKGEFKSSHIEHAIWASAKNLEMYPDKTLRPKKSYIFYCNNGNRSGELASLLRKKSGFETYFISHGLESWNEARLSLTKKEQ